MIDRHQRELLTRFLNGQCSADEEREARAILDLPGAKEFLHSIMMEDAMQTEQDRNASEDTAFQNKATRLKRQVHERIAEAAYRRQYHSWSSGQLVRYAAVFIGFVMLAGAVWFWNTENTTDGQQLAVHAADILPGENKAKLMLADGSVISLDDVQNGTIAIQGGVRVEKDAEGNIRYHADGKGGTATLAMNSIATPKGGQYRITLPDGSVAMLNAASTLSYPVSFTGGERRVKMTGEVYFEIEKMPLPNGKGNMPFFVETAGQEVHVLGTHFNINAYGNEAAIRTTLVEGSVKVRSDDGRSVLLKPGQQAVLAKELAVQQTDIQQQLAWVNGDFVFRGETLESVLRQVERWYDISVEYPPHIGKLRFNGMVSRSQPLSAIVKMIQSTKKATVTIRERRLIVTD